MEIIQDQPIPKKLYKKEWALDIEMFGQRKGKLHLPEGTFASIQLGNEETVYVFTSIESARENGFEEVFREAATLIGHNLQYDIRQLRRWFVLEPRPIWDTMLVEQNLFAGYYNSFSLASAVRRWLQIYMPKQVREQFATSTVLTPEQITYAAEDSYYTYKVKQAQAQYIKKNKRNMYTYDEIDMWMTWVVLDMPPVKVDAQRWIDFTSGFKAKGQEIEQEVLGFNSKSVPQTKQAIQDKLHITVQKTGKATLEEINDDFTDAIIEARHWRDAYSKYGPGWVSKYVDADGYVRSSWKISEAATGRTASADPPLQQIPSKAIKGYRDLFVQSKGELTIIDINSQEPCIMACESGDKALLKLLNEGGDPHLDAARHAFEDMSITKETPNEHGTGTLRNDAKAISLGTNYGLTKVGLALKLKCSEDKAQKFLDAYFRAHPGIKMWMDRQVRFAYQHWYVDTRAGRRCWINMYTKSSDNNAVNAPIQGGAADFSKLWMVKFWRKCRERTLPFPLILMVHDELVIDHAKRNRAVYTKLLEDSLQETGKELYPEVLWRAEPAHGPTWAAKK